MKTKTALIIALVGFVTFSPGAEPPGAKLVKEVDWAATTLPADATLSKAGEEGKTTLLIKKSDPTPKTYPLFALDKPGVKAKAYAWRGKIRHQSVEGVGYLETWNQFAPAEAGQAAPRYFSRSLAEVGPFRKITGGSGWRALVVPFNAEGAKGDVERIEFNLVLPGRGEVEISGLELLEFADAGAMFAAMGEGSAMAPFGIGAVPFVLQLIVVLAGVGLLIAIIAILLILKRRRNAEQRRMKAMDAM